MNSIRTKVLLIIIPLALTLLGVVSSKLIDARRAANDSQDLLAVASAFMRVSDLVHELQRERGLTAGHLASGGKEFGTELKAQRARLDTKFVALTAYVDSEAVAHLSADAKKVLQGVSTQRAELQRVRSRADAASLSVPDCAAAYTHWFAPPVIRSLNKTVLARSRPKAVRGGGKQAEHANGHA